MKKVPETNCCPVCLEHWCTGVMRDVEDDFEDTHYLSKPMLCKLHRDMAAKEDVFFLVVAEPAADEGIEFEGVYMMTPMQLIRDHPPEGANVERIEQFRFTLMTYINFITNALTLMRNGYTVEVRDKDGTSTPIRRDIARHADGSVKYDA